MRSQMIGGLFVAALAMPNNTAIAEDTSMCSISIPTGQVPAEMVDTAKLSDIKDAEVITVTVPVPGKPTEAKRTAQSDDSGGHAATEKYEKKHTVKKGYAVVVYMKGKTVNSCQ